MSGRSYPVAGGSYPPALADVLAAWSPSPARARAWSAREPVLADLEVRALAALLLDAATSHARRDELLAALVRLARADGDAATAVVVCLLPGLRRMVRRLDCGVDRADLWAELVAQAYAHVRAYDLARRPRKIAANLLLDSMAHTLAWLRREYAWRRLACPLDALSDESAPPLDEGDPLGLAVAYGVVSVADAALVAATRLDGVPLREAATAGGYGYEAAKKRRQRAEASLAGWLTVRE